MDVGLLVDKLNDCGHKYVVEEYTGRKDRRGKKIFENDIMEFSSEEYGWVVYDMEYASWMFDYGEYASYRDPIASDCEKYEVIGTVHDAEGRG